MSLTRVTLGKSPSSPHPPFPSTSGSSSLHDSNLLSGELDDLTARDVAVRLCRATGTARVSELLAKLLAQQVGAWVGGCVGSAGRGNGAAYVFAWFWPAYPLLSCGLHHGSVQDLKATTRTCQATSLPPLCCPAPGTCPIVPCRTPPAVHLPPGLVPGPDCDAQPGHGAAGGAHAAAGGGEGNSGEGLVCVRLCVVCGVVMEAFGACERTGGRE